MIRSKTRALVAASLTSILLLSACASGNETAASIAPPPEPTAVPAPTEAPTTTPEPTAVPTVTPAPSATPVPTATPAPTAIPAPPTPEPTEVPTVEPATEEPATDDPAEDDAAAAEDPAPVGANGAFVFATSCATCHGADGAGTGKGPSIVGIGRFFPDDASPVINLVTNGGTDMPEFGTKLTTDEIDAVVQWVVNTFQ